MLKRFYILLLYIKILIKKVYVNKKNLSYLFLRKPFVLK